MPTYEYKCQDCGTNFEALRAMKDSDSPITCTKCSSNHTVRLLTTCNVNGFSDGSGSYSSHSGCSGCQGGSCASCGH